MHEIKRDSWRRRVSWFLQQVCYHDYDYYYSLFIKYIFIAKISTRRRAIESEAPKYEVTEVNITALRLIV